MIFSQVQGTLRKTFASAVLACTAIALSGQGSLKSYIAKTGNRQELSGSSLGVLAVTLGGDTLVCTNPNTRFVPASNVKVITTGVALHLLSESYRFKTQLAYSGTVTDGVLEGNLYIIGGGDPTTASKDDCATPMIDLFTQWKTIIQSAGIREIHGTIVGDGRGWGGRTACGDWFIEDLGCYFGAVPGALNFYENAQDFKITPGKAKGDAVTVTPSFPDAPWMIFTHDCTTSEPGGGNTLFYENSKLAPFARMGGKYALDRVPKTEECTNNFPEYTCAYYFHNFLLQSGIKVTDAFAEISPYGRIRRDMLLYDDGESASPREEMTVIGETYSPSLGEIIKETLHRSDNFYAEALLKAIGEKMFGNAAPDSALIAERSVLDELGLPKGKSIQIRDGSGLARTNYISPSFFVSFLKAMAGTKEFGVYLGAFPIPGEGTLAGRLPDADPSLRKRVHMKSGSMNGVRCYCGYINPASGRVEDTVVFSVMMNNFTCNNASVSPTMDKIISMIAAAMPAN